MRSPSFFSIRRFLFKGKKEFELLHTIYRQGVDGKLLVSTKRLSDMLCVSNSEDMITSLCKERLIEALYTDRHGEPFVYLSITRKGIEKILGRRKKTRELSIKIILASLSAVITYIIGKLLYLLFK